MRRTLIALMLLALPATLSAQVVVHTVSITQQFWMSKYEVTQSEYQALRGSNPSFFQGASFPNFANRPVEQVTHWNRFGNRRAPGE